MDEEDDLDIAAAMGFSSFGGAKKRKYDQTNSPKAPSVMDASGANSTELGVRPKKTASDDSEVAETTKAGAKPSTSTKKAPPPTGLADFLARAQTLPDKPSTAQRDTSTPNQTDPSASELISFGGPSISRAELTALKFGVKNENGDTAYFLPSFLEDPWERLNTGK
ncbi:hypothetical protein FB567DRAFT_558186 [Paraphoma chrysanthemicola]|uniref:Uncharacterized protein n=1 Tax=Paraphoma chrysanthemicola TaxID=798071 RepID=A0A8K0W1Q8_9PLEO|nr:hypothetical protein FB567DRAFT_558186 [Paraphoma chrysanthemicola]